MALYLLDNDEDCEVLYAGLATALGGNHNFGLKEMNYVYGVRRLSLRGDMHRCGAHIRYFTKGLYGLPGHRIARRSEIQNIATLSPTVGDKMKNRSAGGEGNERADPSIGVDFILLGTAWPLGLVCKGDVSPAVKCQQLRGLLSESCNGNAECQNRMVESAMSLSMFSRNNSNTILLYHRLKADCQTQEADSPQSVAFLKMKLHVWDTIRLQQV